MGKPINIELQFLVILKLVITMDQASGIELLRADGITKYEPIQEIGRGGFGHVFKVKNRENGEFFAIKKVKFEGEEKDRIIARREMTILFRNKHRNIVNLIEAKVTQGGAHIHYVMEYCPFDLSQLLGWTYVRFSLAEIKGLLQQLMEGLSFLHQKRIMHRDIKNNNILINKEGEVKICDFGMARSMRTPLAENIPNLYTPKVVTLWYRSPEVLLGRRNYDFGVDMWAAGCLMVEMFTREPILQGQSEIHQLYSIINLCGSITPVSYPGVENMAIFRKIRLPANKRRRVTERIRDCVKDENGVDLIDKLLVIDPAQRVDANTALNHNFFQTEPHSCDLKDMVSRFTESICSISESQRTQLGFSF